MAAEATFRARDRSIEVLLLCRNRQHDEALPESCVDRANLAGSLLGAQLKQANVSRIEHTENLYLRTLADYVGALGGHIEVNAVFDDDVVPLGLVEKDRGSVAA